MRVTCSWLLQCIINSCHVAVGPKSTLPGEIAFFESDLKAIMKNAMGDPTESSYEIWWFNFYADGTDEMDGKRMGIIVGRKKMDTGL
jgi:hypothetical protein